MTTREQIIAAAKEARIDFDEINTSLPLYIATVEEMERFYAIAFEAGRVAEREKCTKVCEDRLAIHQQNYGGYIGQHSTIAEAKACAEAIRARGESK